jgi:glyceraldehyde 3-phosphate dehydrogenase
VAVNDTAKADLLTYLLKYDAQVSGVALSLNGDFISVKGKNIKILAEPDPAKLPWRKLKVDLALECTGLFATGEKASAHLASGAKKVLIAGPAADDVPVIVYGVNETAIHAGDRIVSAGSPALNSLAILARALNGFSPIRSGIALALHNRIDPVEPAAGQERALRSFRSAAAGIVPALPGIGTINRVIPELAGKIALSAQGLPLDRGAETLLFATLEDQDLSVEKLNRAIKAKSGKVLGYTEEEIVSTDVIDTVYGSLFDATQTLVQPLGGGLYQVQVAAWYDHRSSYPLQVVRTARYFAELSGKTGTAAKRKTTAGSPPLPRKPLIKFPT